MARNTPIQISNVRWMRRVYEPRVRITPRRRRLLNSALIERVFSKEFLSRLFKRREVDERRFIHSGGILCAALKAHYGVRTFGDAARLTHAELESTPRMGAAAYALFLDVAAALSHKLPGVPGKELSSKRLENESARKFADVFGV